MLQKDYLIKNYILHFIYYITLHFLFSKTEANIFYNKYKIQFMKKNYNIMYTFYLFFDIFIYQIIQYKNPFINIIFNF